MESIQIFIKLTPLLLSLIHILNEIGVQTFGVPNAEIALKTWEKQNIHYKDAIDVKEDIQSLLKQFEITLSDDMLAS